ncbi:uncharacterized protein LOC124955555 [Vespa velutina]|uniref:uncharacterized protein LOC124955555 n=1 Tax=Vespa velutina TaxID=202808 RepID=UPI001FB2E86B|nr:uncharacterized protein LOC124955555 [Vespa velutina]
MILTIILISLLTVIFINILSKLYKFYVFRKTINKIPGDASFFGTIINFSRLSKEEYHRIFYQYTDRYKEGICKLWMGYEAIVHVYKPEYVEVILKSTTNIKKSSIYDGFKPWLGDGLVTSSGSKWHHDRKLINPAFHFSMLDNFMIVMLEKSEILIDRIVKEIEKNIGQNAVNIYPLLLDFALDVICETAMGVNVYAQDNTKIGYSDYVHNVTNAIIYRNLRPWLKLDSIFALTAEGKQFYSSIKEIHRFNREVIKMKKEARRENCQDDREFDELGRKKRKAFIDILLDINENNSNQLSEEDMNEQVATIMFAGHDTSATAIFWTLLCLATEPEIQDKVYEELTVVFDNLDGPISMNTISQLKYLDRVCKETLRLYPVVPKYSRQITEEIKIGKYVIPKNTLLTIHVHGLHYDPEIWTDPEKFDPDRFLTNETQYRNPFSYIPFSAGPRNCIGQKFANLEQKLVIAILLRKWMVKSSILREDIKICQSAVLRPLDDVYLRFIPRKCKSFLTIKEHTSSIFSFKRRKTARRLMVLTIILIALLTVLFINILSKLYKFYVFRKTINKIPGDASFFDTAINFSRLSKDEYHKAFCQYTVLYKEGIYKLWMGYKPKVYIYKPEYVEIILRSTTNIKKSSTYDSFKPWLGDGLVTSSGSKWHHDRKLINPAFHFSMLEDFMIVIIEKCEILIDRIEKEMGKNIGKNEVNIYPLIADFALDVICETAMGVNIHAQDNTNTGYPDYVQKATNGVLYRYLRPWLKLDSIFALTAEGKQFYSSVKEIHRFNRELIKMKKEARREKCQDDSEFDELGRKKGKAFIDILLDINENNSNQFSEEDMDEQVATLMFAGHDTSATAIFWTLLCLATEPEIQDKVYEELKDVFDDLDGPISMNTISQLKHLDRVCKESLRLYTVVPELSRQITKEITIGKYVIPKNTILAIHVHGLHHDPEIWPDPEKFDPDRFLTNEMEYRNPYSFLPFSAGPRNCIGQKFADLEHRLVIAILLRKWIVKSSILRKDMKIYHSAILRPLDDVYLRFIPRK